MEIQHSVLLSIQRKKPSTYLNPEFRGIAKQLGRSQHSKKKAKDERKALSNRVAYLQKEDSLALKTLQKKQRELQKLMNTIARKQADEQQKEARRRERQDRIAQQRQTNMRRRSEHQAKLREAFLCLYDDHQQNSKSMRSTFNQHQSMIKSMYRENLRQKQEKVIRRSMARQQSRKRLNSYFKQKNDMFTSRYKQKIRRENEQANRTIQEANRLKRLQDELSHKLESKANRIEELNESIRQAMESKSIVGNSSLNWSRTSKNYRTFDTKEESLKETDSKLQKFIEKELSLNQQFIQKN